MGFSSQAGQFVVATQTDVGVPVEIDDSTGVALKLRSGSLAPNRELLIPDPEIGGGRDTVDAYLGTVSFSGDLDYYVRLEGFATLLAAALGNASSTTDDEVTTHTVTPSDGNLLPVLSIQERIGSGLDAYEYQDVVVNTLHVEAEANGYLTGTAGLIAPRQVAIDSPEESPVWDDSPMIVGTNITLTYGGVQLPAKSFSLDINNNFADDDFRLGSFFLSDLTPQNREVTASVTLRHESKETFRQATYGLANATAVGGLTTKEPLEITCETYEVIGGSSVKSSLTITLPKVILEPFAFEPSGADVLESDIEMRAVRPDAGVDILTAVVVNGRDEIA